MAGRKINKRLIQSLLAESAFNPNEKTPFSMIVNEKNPDYAEFKAMELVSEAKAAYKGGSLVTYNDKLTQAISLLVLARAQRGQIQA